MRCALLVLLLLIPLPAWPAITVDSVTTTPGEGLNTTNPSLSHTAAADATLALACFTERDTTLAMGAGPSVTYNGSAMTLVTGATQTQSSRLKSSLFYYVSPPSGSVTVAGTRSTNSNRSLLSVITLKGTATSSIFNTAGTTGAASGTNIDIDSLASALGEFAVMCGVLSTNTPAVSPDATSTVSTERLEADHSDEIGLTHFLYTEAGAATSIDMRVDSDTSAYFSAVAVSIRAAAAASTPRQSVVIFP